MQKSKQRTNGHDTDQETEQVLDELGLQEQILKSSGGNPLLEGTNLGLGNYDTDYKWQQVRSYRKGLYAWIAFGNTLTKRQIYETKIKLGRNGFNAIYDDRDREVKTFPPLEEAGDDPEDEERSSWNRALDRGRKIWRRLGDPHQIFTEDQISAISQKTGIDSEWQPLFWELVAGRHEVSRSEEAELLRDALTGIKELRTQDDSSDSLLPTQS